MSSYKLMLIFPLAALALPASHAQEARPAAPAAHAPSQQGMVVVRDAQTGELRAPTPDEARALQAPSAAAARAAAPQPAMVTGPGGSRSVRVGESHMVYSVVTRDGSGKLHDQCLHGEHAAHQALDKHTPATTTKERRNESR